MEMLNMFRVIAIGVVFLATAGNLSAAPNVPNDIHEKFWAAGSVYIDRIAWPPEDKAISFKSLVIGSAFDPNSNDVFVITGKESIHSAGKRPLVCKFDKFNLLPALTCEVILWSGVPQYSEQLRALKTAFGAEVKVYFEVVLDKTLTLDEANNGILGMGKVSLVQLTNKSPTDDFNEKAIAYFSKQFGAEPTTESKYRRPQEVYSRSCVRSMARIKKKPVSDLSIDERNTLAKCQNEAKAAVLAGKAISGSTVIYRWEGAGQRAELFSSTRKSYGASAKESKISIAADSQSALDQWTAEATKVKELWKKAEDQAKSSDF